MNTNDIASGLAANVMQGVSVPDALLGPVPSWSVDFTQGVGGGLSFSRASGATSFDATGKLVTAASSVARLDFDPVSHAALGLLVEEARTNLLLQSHNFAAASWLKVSGVTITTGVDGPWGTGTAFLLNNVSAGAGRLEQTVTVVSGSTYTVTADFKQGNQATAMLRVDATATMYISLDLAAGSITGSSGTPVNPTIMPLGNGWYRASFTFAATGTSCIVRLYSSATAGATVCMDNAGLELGSFASSTIVTTTAAATRVQDVCGGTTFAGFNPHEGTLIVEAAMAGVKPGTGTPTAVSIDAGNDSNRVQVCVNSSGQPGARVVVGGTNIVAADGTALAVRQKRKLAVAYKSGDTDYAFGGVAGTAVTAAFADLAGFVNLHIGAGSAGTVPFTGWIRKISYYNTRLSNAQLAQLTS